MWLKSEVGQLKIFKKFSKYLIYYWYILNFRLDIDIDIDLGDILEKWN